VEQGDIVLAIGSPFRYAFSVSQGIVSATERHVGILGPQGYESFIQTDTAINPGNSGGPLVNARGEVVGMCTAIASRSGAFAGLGFATPVDLIREVADALIRDGRVKRGYLGTVISDDRSVLATFGAEAGVLIEDMVEDGPADQAGLQPGDVITAMDDEAVEDAATLRERVARSKPGQSIRLRLLREGEQAEVQVTLGQQPVEPGNPKSRLRWSRPPEEPEEAEALAKLGFQRLVALTPAIAREYDLERSQGILVLGVRQFSSAAIAGLRQGHIIVQVHGQEVTDIDGLRQAVEARDLDEGVRMRVQAPGGPARFVLLSLQ
jgi:serine protease Do